MKYMRKLRVTLQNDQKEEAFSVCERSEPMCHE